MMPHTAVRWATESGAAVGDVLHAWHIGDTVSLPVGNLWHVLRVTRRTAVPTLHKLRAAGIALGPVLETAPRDALEWLVPTGTAHSWPALRGTVCTDRGSLRCPAPEVTAGHPSAAGGRRWIVPPLTGVPPVTDADALCEAVAAVLFHVAQPHLVGHQVHGARSGVTVRGPSTALTEGGTGHASAASYVR